MKSQNNLTPLIDHWEIKRMVISQQRLIGIIIVLVLIFIAVLTKIYGGYLFTFTIPILYDVIIRNRKFDSIGLSVRIIRTSLIWGVVSGIVLALLFAIFFTLLSVQRIKFFSISPSMIISEFMIVTADTYLLKKSVSTMGLIFYILYVLFAIGLGEEIFWRGFIQKKINKRFSRKKAILITTAFFVLVHIYFLACTPLITGLLLLFSIGIASIVWGYLSFYCNNIYGSALSHAIVAFVVWRCLLFNQLINF